MSEPVQPADREEVAALRAIVDGTARHTGEEFFRSLVRNLSATTGVPNAFVAEFAGAKTRVRTLAFWKGGMFLPNDEWDLAGTPCEDVLNGNTCHHPMDVRHRFPIDPGSADVESYLGVPLRDSAGHVLGHLAVFDARPMPAEPKLLYTFQIFGTRDAVHCRQVRPEEARARHLHVFGIPPEQHAERAQRGRRAALRAVLPAQAQRRSAARRGRCGGAREDIVPRRPERHAPCNCPTTSRIRTS